MQPGSLISPATSEEVARYSFQHLDLRRELASLERVWGAEVPEAGIVLCSRILEVLSQDAVQRAGSTPSHNLYSNLLTLDESLLIPQSTLWLAHSVRRVGNDVRHVRRAVAQEDACSTAVFLERCIDWFFCSFPLGPRLPALTSTREPLLVGELLALRHLVGQVLDLARGEATTLAGLSREVQQFQSPTLWALLAEALIERGRLDEAGAFLEEARVQVPDEVRLTQLLGLLLSRRGEPGKAIEILDELARQAGEDEESTGILAGAWKRRWQEEPRRRDFLERSFRAYSKGWRDSRKASTYLGINAAATALWLGQESDATRLAGEVKEKILARRCARTELVKDFWISATLAEAQLLSGECEEAVETYLQTFRSHPTRRGSHQSACRQAVRHLMQLDRKDLAQALESSARTIGEGSA